MKVWKRLKEEDEEETTAARSKSNPTAASTKSSRKDSIFKSSERVTAEEVSYAEDYSEPLLLTDSSPSGSSFGDEASGADPVAYEEDESEVPSNAGQPEHGSEVNFETRDDPSDTPEEGYFGGEERDHSDQMTSGGTHAERFAGEMPILERVITDDVKLSGDVFVAFEGRSESEKENVVTETFAMEELQEPQMLESRAMGASFLDASAPAVTPTSRKSGNAFVESPVAADMQVLDTSFGDSAAPSLSPLSCRSGMGFGQVTPSPLVGQSVMLNAPLLTVESQNSEESQLGHESEGGEEGCHVYATAPTLDESSHKTEHKSIATASSTHTLITARQELAIHAIEEKEYLQFLQIISDNPEMIALKMPGYGGKNLLHILASQQESPPESLLLKTISECPSAVGNADDTGNVPLHCAATHASHLNLTLFKVLLRFHSTGASRQNHAGDLPLHLAVSCGLRGAEDVTKELLKAYPMGIEVKNSRGERPLHLACTLGSSNIACTKAILTFHKMRKHDISMGDNDGVTPLHAALIYGAPENVINSFRDCADSFPAAYTAKDKVGNIPLHVALHRPQTDPNIIRSLIGAAPHTGGIPTYRGKMPVWLASARSLDHDIIHDILKADMPIEIGAAKDESAPTGDVVERKHGDSWWHVAIKCRDKYIKAIENLLSGKATPVQVLFLGRCMGPDGATRVVDAAPPQLKILIKKLLCVVDGRYDICLDQDLHHDKNVHSCAAIDNGRFEAHPIVIKNTACDDGVDYDVEVDNDDISVEVSLIVNTEQDLSHRDQPQEVPVSEPVKLCFYGTEQEVQAEVDVRRYYRLSNEFAEDLKATHVKSEGENAITTMEFSNGEEISSCTDVSLPGAGKLYCIAYEEPDFTLEEALEIAPRGDVDWLQTCQVILANVAHALHHFHHRGMIHGYIEPKHILKINDSWKLSKIGCVTPVGCAMSGVFRSCVPPEAVTDTRVSIPKITPNSKKDNDEVISPQKAKPKTKKTTRKMKGMKQVGRTSHLTKSGPHEDGSKSQEVSSPASHKQTATNQSKVGKQSMAPIKEDKILMDGTMNESLHPARERDEKQHRRRKRKGFFLFSMRDMGLGDYGWYESKKYLAYAGSVPHETAPDSNSSSRLLAVQDEEIRRLRKALEDRKREEMRAMAEETINLNKDMKGRKMLPNAYGRKRQLTEKKHLKKKKELSASKKRDVLLRLSKQERDQEQRGGEDKKFTPERCTADPTWDVFALGVLMARLILNNSDNLPAFAPTEGAMMERLFSYDKEHAERLQEEVCSVAGSTTGDLLIKLIDPDLQNRIQTMEEVLQHKFFRIDVFEDFGGSDGHSSISSKKSGGVSLSVNGESGGVEVLNGDISVMSQSSLSRGSEGNHSSGSSRSSSEKLPSRGTSEKGTSKSVASAPSCRSPKPHQHSHHRTLSAPEQL